MSLMPKPDRRLLSALESPALYRGDADVPAFEVKFLLTETEAHEAQRRLRTVLAPRLNAVAWLAMLSVLSTNGSIRSPRDRICSTFCTMMSFTCASSAWARESSSVGGEVL